MENKYNKFLNLGTIVGVLAFFSGIWLLYDGQTFIGISGSITGLFVAYISSFGVEKKV